jgi:hypothetical protein
MNNTHKPAVPYGAGSVQKRRASLWMIYRDTNGKTINENSHTADWDEATRLLCQRALPALEARVAEVKRIAEGTPSTARKQKPAQPLRVTLVDRSDPNPQPVIDRALAILARAAERRAAEKAKDGAKEKATPKRAGSGDLPGRGRGNTRNAGQGHRSGRGAAADRPAKKRGAGSR